MLSLLTVDFKHNTVLETELVILTEDTQSNRGRMDVILLDDQLQQNCFCIKKRLQMDSRYGYGWKHKMHEITIPNYNLYPTSHSRYKVKKLPLGCQVALQQSCSKHVKKYHFCNGWMCAMRIKQTCQC